MENKDLSTFRESVVSKLNDIKWIVVDTHLAYRFVSNNFIEVLTTEMIETVVGGKHTYSFNVHNRVGAISTFDEASVSEFLKSNNIEHFNDEDFISEFEMPKCVFILHNMKFDKGGRKNYIEAILNSKPMNNDDTVTFIQNYINQNGGLL